jgi:hypothetical protein
VETFFLCFHPQIHSHQAFVWVEDFLMHGEADSSALQLQNPIKILFPVSWVLPLLPLPAPRILSSVKAEKRVINFPKQGRLVSK